MWNMLGSLLKLRYCCYVFYEDCYENYVKDYVYDDLYYYVKYVKMCDVMNESLIMYRMKCKWNDDYVQGVFTCTHSHLKKCMMLILAKKGVFGWTLFVSWDKVSSSNPNIPNEIFNKVWRMNSVR